MHISVLKDEIVEFSSNLKGKKGYILDCTLGMGGHTRALLGAYENSILVGIDQDGASLELTDALLKEFPNRFKAKKLNFSELDQLDSNFNTDLRSYDLILADLGFSSFQLDNPERGLSFKLDGPLDMRLDQKGALTAADILNNFAPNDLKRILAEGGVGEERKYVVSAIMNNRPFSRTKELSDLCERVSGARRPKKGKAGSSGESRGKLTSVVFQALRMHVNGEKEALSSLLFKSISRLGPEGRMLVISFHSGEDKLVAGSMRWWAQKRGKGDHPEDEPIGKILTPKAVIPTEAEIANNPRSRSARLRVFERNKIPLWQERSLVPNAY